MHGVDKSDLFWDNIRGYFSEPSKASIVYVVYCAHVFVSVILTGITRFDTDSAHISLPDTNSIVGDVPVEVATLGGRNELLCRSIVVP